MLVVPTLFIISLIAFILSKNTPQDPVSSMLNLKGMDQEVLDDEVYKKTYQELSLDLANFYLSVVPQNYPDNLNKVYKLEDRVLYKKLLSKGYRFEFIDDAFEKFDSRNYDLSKSNDQQGLIKVQRSKLDAEEFLQEVGVDKKNASKSRFYYPTLRWHGTHNQYHEWLKKVFFNGFGASITDGIKAISKVKKALTWTLSFTLIDFILSIILGLLLGYYLAYKPEGKSQKLLRQVLYLFYAVPVFWLATVLVVYFTTADYGTWTNIFPSVGINIYPEKSTLTQIVLNSEKLILPILCLSLHSLAYVSRMVEKSLTDELSKDYVLYAYSKGLSKRQIIKGEVFKNALTPSITLFMSSFASAFSGSLVIEVIFNIPGMGRLLFNALSIADWNVVFCVLIILSLVTIISYIIGDILYAIFNPRIKYT